METEEQPGQSGYPEGNPEGGEGGGDQRGGQDTDTSGAPSQDAPDEGDPGQATGNPGAAG